MNQTSPDAESTTRTKPTSSTSPPTLSGRFQAGLRLIRVRLRFVLVLLVMALVVGQWDWFTTHFHRWTDSWWFSARSEGVSPDTEYFCPMCPGVLSAWPDTCAVCNMPLVRRRKGEMTTLPTGVIARMQFTPQRVQLAGVQTEALRYEPLQYQLETLARLVEVTTSSTAQRHVVIEFLSPAEELWGRTTSWELRDARDVASAMVVANRLNTDDSTTTNAALRFKLELTADQLARGNANLREGTLLRVTAQVAVAELPPFATQPHAELVSATEKPRRVYRCSEHPEQISPRAGKCPLDERTLEPFQLHSDQQLRWCCERHSAVLATSADEHCPDCAEQELVPRVVTFTPPGHVLAVPESAVIDTGKQTIAYVETEAGSNLFEGILIRVGRRTGGLYPVIEGLHAGERVVTRGAFLIDAETRLNPSLASTYFGATASNDRTKTKQPAELVEVRKLLAKFDMPAADRELAEQQRTCPVTGMALGSMGKPPKKNIAGQSIFICCEGCATALKRTNLNRAEINRANINRADLNHTEKPRSTVPALPAAKAERP